MSRLTSWAAGHLLDPVNTTVSYGVNATAPIKIPGPGDLIECFLQGRLKQKAFVQLLQFYGFNASVRWEGGDTAVRRTYNKLGEIWGRVIDSKMAVPSPEQLLELANRFGWTELKLREGFNRNKMDPTYVDEYAELRNQIPPASDLILFALRECFDPTLLQQFGYDSEYPQQLTEWLGKQGLAYPIASPAHAAAGLPVFDWAHCYWWSHWQLPSPGQGLDMLHRLRYSLRDPQVPRDPSQETFTQTEFARLLKAQDYPPYWRDKLAAIGFRPIGIRNLRALWATGLVDEVEVTEIFLDQGYNMRDATVQARLIATEKQVAALASARKRNLAQVIRSYHLGLIDVPEFRRQAYRMTRTTEADLVSFDQAGQAGQDALAIADQATMQITDSEELHGKLDRAQRTIVFLHRSYVRGQINDQVADTQLTNLGIVEEKRAQYKADWSLEKNLVRRQSGVAQIVKWMREGLIGGQDAANRLFQLGVSQADSDLLLTDATLESVSRRVQAIQRTASTVRTQRKAAQALARQAIAAQRAAAAQLAKTTNLGRLAGWLRKGYVTPAEFASRASAIGVLPEDIGHYLSEAQQLAADRAAKALERQERQLGTTPPPRRQPPAATVASWLKKGIISEGEARVRLLNLGLDQAAVQNFLRQSGLGVSTSGAGS